MDLQIIRTGVLFVAVVVGMPLLMNVAYSQESNTNEVFIGTTMVSFSVVEKRRVSRTAFEYTFKATIQDPSMSLPPVLATISSGSSATEIIDADVRFPATAVGQVSSSFDTFTLRQDRQTLFDPNVLVWNLQTDGTPTTVFTLPPPNPNPCDEISDPCEAGQVGKLVYVSTITGGLVSTSITESGNPVASLRWLPREGGSELLVTFPSFEESTFAELDAPPPDLRNANIVAAAFASLNAEAAAGNTAGCDELNVPDGFPGPGIDCTRFGGCCDIHDLCIDRNCQGPNDSGNVRDCALSATALALCLLTCNDNPDVECSDCTKIFPQCSGQCNVCHLEVIACFHRANSGDPTIRPHSACCDFNNCGEPQVCIGDDAIVRTKACACPPPPEGHPTCDPGGGALGDPHLMTFDRLAYDFQAVGEFVLARSIDNDFEIQIRTKPWGYLRVASVTSAVASHVGGDRVALYLDRNPALLVNGEATSLDQGETLSLGSGGSVLRASSYYLVVWPDGSEMRVDILNGYLNVWVRPSAERKGRMVGLLGDYNGEHEDDLVTRDGNPIGIAPDFDSMYRVFGDSWRIDGQESLFDYAIGQGTETFTDLSFPGSFVTTQSLSPETRALAESTCRVSGITEGIAFEWCVLDVGLTGESHFVDLPSALCNTAIAIVPEEPDPTVTDSDGDGLKNSDEQTRGTNPFVRDTDGDGLSDGQEVLADTDPLDPLSVSLSISYGETTAGAIDPATERETYYFSGTTGDRVLVRMTSLSTFFGATFRVYRPDGSLLCSQTRGNAGMIEQVCALDVAGNHLIVLSDDNGTDSGNYNLALQRLNGPANATPIAYGETVAGSIIPAGELDHFVFTGAVGDQALVRMTSLSTFFGATFRVYRPDGSLLCSQTRGNAGMIEQVCALDVAGNHLIVLSDDNGTDSGNYNLALQRLNGPANATPIAYGETVAGSIIPAGELDHFVFTGAVGDQALVRMTSLSTFFGATFQVYRPDGSLLCSQTRGNAGMIEQVCALDVAGNHLIVLSDDNGTDSGNYNLALQRLNGPANATPIAYGETVAGSIIPAGELDHFVFTGAVGDQALVRMTSLSTFFGATFRVYRPDGSLLCSQTRGNAGMIEQVCALDVAGNHLIVLSDDNGTDSGNYNLALQRLNGPANATPIAYGETVAGSIIPAGELDHFVFTGAVGDQALVRMTSLSTFFGATFRVYRPDGSLLCSQTRGNAGMIEQVCALDVAGNHLIVLSDDNGTDSGNYNLALQRLNGPANATPLKINNGSRSNSG